jgi:hypothetical protein
MSQSQQVDAAMPVVAEFFTSLEQLPDLATHFAAVRIIVHAFLNTHPAYKQYFAEQIQGDIARVLKGGED